MRRRLLQRRDCPPRPHQAMPSSSSLLGSLFGVREESPLPRRTCPQPRPRHTLRPATPRGLWRAPRPGPAHAGTMPSTATCSRTRPYHTPPPPPPPRSTSSTHTSATTAPHGAPAYRAHAHGHPAAARGPRGSRSAPPRQQPRPTAPPAAKAKPSGISTIV